MRATRAGAASASRLGRTRTSLLSWRACMCGAVHATPQGKAAAVHACVIPALVLLVPPHNVVALHPGLQGAARPRPALCEGRRHVQALCGMQAHHFFSGGGCMPSQERPSLAQCNWCALGYTTWPGAAHWGRSPPADSLEEFEGVSRHSGGLAWWFSKECAGARVVALDGPAWLGSGGVEVWHSLGQA